MAGQGPCGSGAAACIAVDHALAFVDGTLMPAERAEVERRIDACAACRAVVADAARGTGAALVCDARGRTSVQRRPRVTAPLRAPGAAGRASRRGASHPAPASAHRGYPAEPPPGPVGEPGAPPGAGGDHPGDRGARPRLDADLAAGEVVGRYVVERPLGAGGMGVVSLARDPELRRPVVIKLVHPGMGYGEGGDELEARLRREAQAMAQVSHSNVVQIFDIGRRGDRVFLAMEFIAGQTLDAWLRERPRTPDEIFGVIRRAGAGLAAAHRAGLVHRDFKPSNVLVGADGIVKVTDFGLARSIVGPSAGATLQLRLPRTAPHASGVHAVLTEANAVVGTPAYMAPEQAAGAPIDARTDQYALAVTLLDALTGQSPTRRTVHPDDPAAIDAGLVRAGIAPPVRAAIVRALSVDPAARFAAIDELLQVLAPPPAPPPAPGKSRRVALVIAGVALCGTAAATWLGFGRGTGPPCSAEAPLRWTAARARVIAALSAAPRPFSGWDAERVAAQLDGAVAALGTAETARCRGEPAAERDAGAGCIARRTAALGAALAALSASPPPDDPWALIPPIERCDGAANPVAAELRGKLRGATTAAAREIAGEAQKLGDALLTADALEVAGVAALAAGDAKLAADQFRAMAAAGLQADSGAVQGRALLHLIDVARYSGEYETADQQLGALDALLKRYRESPRDVVTAALAEGEAFTDLGDVATAFAAWDRARVAAAALGDPDATLAAAIGGAWSMHALRFDLPRARAAADAALAAGAAASPAARARALGIAAELALEAHDGRAAEAALDEADRLIPAQTATGAGRLRALRARALLGDVDGAVAELVPAPSDDATTAARIGIARGKLLLAADHVSEAGDVLDRVSSATRRYGRGRAALPIAERIDLELAACEAQLAAAGTCKTTYRIDLLLARLHPRAPARARLAILDARNAPPESGARREHALTLALDLLIDAGAAPIRIAELRWQVAQICALGADCRRLATAAREVFQAAGRTAEVGEIDRWFADQPPLPSAASHDAGAAPDPALPSRRDTWGPQP